MLSTRPLLFTIFSTICLPLAIAQQPASLPAQLSVSGIENDARRRIVTSLLERVLFRRYWTGAPRDESMASCIQIAQLMADDIEMSRRAEQLCECIATDMPEDRRKSEHRTSVPAWFYADYVDVLLREALWQWQVCASTDTSLYALNETTKAFDAIASMKAQVSPLLLRWWLRPEAPFITALHCQESDGFGDKLQRLRDCIKTPGCREPNVSCASAGDAAFKSVQGAPTRWTIDSCGSNVGSVVAEQEIMQYLLWSYWLGNDKTANEVLLTIMPVLRDCKHLCPVGVSTQFESNWRNPAASQMSGAGEFKEWRQPGYLVAYCALVQRGLYCEHFERDHDSARRFYEVALLLADGFDGSTALYEKEMLLAQIRHLRQK